MRRRLPAGVRMYTGDDFNYAELIAGDGVGSAPNQRHSDALLGIFDAIAPAASAALAALAAGDVDALPRDPRRRPCRCRATSSRRRRASTRPASSSWPGSTATSRTSRWSAASRARARCCTSPSCSGSPTRPACSSSPSSRCARMQPPAGAARRRRLRPIADARLLAPTTAGSRSTPRPCAARGDARPHHRGVRRATASARSRRGATRSPRSASSAPPRWCARTASSSRATAAAACSRRSTPPAARPRSTTTGAPSTRRRRWTRACLVLVVGGLPGALAGTPRYKDIARARAATCATASPRRSSTRASVGMPLAIEPLHPMYAADRACVNTLEQALDLCDALDPRAQRRARRRRRRLSRLVGPEARSADRARRQRAPARLPRLRLAGADARPAQRPRHDGRRRDRAPAASAAGSRRPGFAGYSEVEIFSTRELVEARRPTRCSTTCIERHRSAV